MNNIAPTTLSESVVVENAGKIHSFNSGSRTVFADYVAHLDRQESKVSNIVDGLQLLLTFVGHEEGPELFRVRVDEEAYLRQDSEPDVLRANAEVVMVTISMKCRPDKAVPRWRDVTSPELTADERRLHQGLAALVLPWGGALQELIG